MKILKTKQRMYSHRYFPVFTVFMVIYQCHRIILMMITGGKYEHY